MHKKLFVSFLYISIFFIILTQAAIACGGSVPSQKSILDVYNADIDNYTGEASSPSDSFMLIRTDFPIVEQSISADSNSNPSSDDKIIYSPDLPAPFGQSGSEYASDEANIYIGLEVELINKVNEERVAAGQHELIYCQELSYFARLHSKDMSDNHFFSHTSPYNGSYVTRLYDSGINYISSGENLARFSDIEDAHEALMKSFGHKKNMLSSKYTHVGIGITYDECLEVYCITQWFAKFYE